LVVGVAAGSLEKMKKMEVKVLFLFFHFSYQQEPSVITLEVVG